MKTIKSHKTLRLAYINAYNTWKQAVKKQQIIDLKIFALTGYFSNVRIGMTQSEVIDILGTPNDCADFGTGFSGINYDGYEFFFHSDTKQLSTIQNDNLSLHDSLVLFENTQFKIDPWLIKPNETNTYNDVLVQLKKQHIRITQTTENENWQVLRFDSGVRFLFNSEEQGGVLHAISYHPHIDNSLEEPFWKNCIPTVLTLESAEQYETVYPIYQAITSNKNNEPLDFDLWMHYFFFLWHVSEGCIGQLSFDSTLEQDLLDALNHGEKHFTDHAEFHFLTGYCMHMLPYLFGDYEYYELEGLTRLARATQLAPENPLYKMIEMGGSIPKVHLTQAYKSLCKESNAYIKSHYQGDGILNEYIRGVMYRNE